VRTARRNTAYAAADGGASGALTAHGLLVGLLQPPVQFDCRERCNQPIEYLRRGAGPRPDAGGGTL
jgi:hypothetical protein